MPHSAKSVNSNNHFLTGGADYASARPTYPMALADILAVCAPNNQTALDVGCGNGQLSVLLADKFKNVVATDPSQEQLDSAFNHPCVEYRSEAAERISLPDRSVDLITAAQAAHWFDLDAFYEEVRRVGRNDAIIALISYGVPKMASDIGERLDHFYWQEIHDFWPSGREHVETGYASLDFPFSEDPFPDLVIERDMSLEQLIAYIRTWSASKKAIAAGHGEILDRFLQDLRRLWSAPEVPFRIEWPIVGRIGPIHDDHS